MVHTKKNKSGFTLVELLVTTSIFVIMTALMVAKFGNLNQGVLLTNLAYDVALTIRTAQTYGVSVQGTALLQQIGVTPSNIFSYAYGVNLVKGDTQMTLFVDSYNVNQSTGEGNHIFDSANNLEGGIIYYIKRGAKIAGFCKLENCSFDPNATSPSRVDITFLRPNPDAVICVDGDCSANYVRIFVQATDRTTRSVTVRQTGQISVDD